VAHCDARGFILNRQVELPAAEAARRAISLLRNDQSIFLTSAPTDQPFFKPSLRWGIGDQRLAQTLAHFRTRVDSEQTTANAKDRK
jgi:hypothetical protein